MPIEQIEISKIRRDGGTQARTGLDKDAVRDYASRIRDGVQFPPVRVFFDSTDYWLSDGFHRTEAHVRAGRTEILADVMPGTLRDAQWDSFGANKANGLRWTGEDVKRALYRIFKDDQWKTKSQREIAAHVGCKKSWVNELLERYRRETGRDGPRAGPEPVNKRRRAVLPAATDRAATIVPQVGDGSFVIHHTSALRSGLPDRSVHTCITSPPFWLHREYGTEPEVWGGDPSCVHSWNDASFYRKGTTDGRAAVTPATCGAVAVKCSTCHRCRAYRCELGQEPTPDLFVAHLVEVFREVWRVLRDDGICWVNLGDTYIAETRAAGGRGKQHTNRGSVRADRSGTLPEGLSPKNLALVPFRFALAMQAEGWYCRSVAPWVKANAFPESVKDRPAVAVEQWLMFTKDDTYYYDPEAVKQPLANESIARARRGHSGDHKWSGSGQTLNTSLIKGIDASGRGRRDSDTWYESIEGLASVGRGRMEMVTGPDGTPLGFDFPTTGYEGSHYAAYPHRMIEPLILSSTSEACCATCLTPWRTLERAPASEGPDFEETRTASWEKRCGCQRSDCVPATVYDPFTGVASTAIASLDLGRRFVGTEMNAHYVQQGRDRIAKWREGRMKQAV